MIWVWTAVIAVSLIIEFMTMELVSVWLAIGGVVGLILEIIGVDMTIQIVVVVVVGVGCIIGLRKFALKFLNNKSEDKDAEIFVGHKAKIIDAVDTEKNGTVKFNGVIWTVTSNEKIESGEEVEIVELAGNKLVVKKASK